MIGERGRPLAARNHSQRTAATLSPVAVAMPVPVPAPMVAVVPTPVTVVVVPAPMMAVPVMTPAHFLRLETIDFALVGDGRMGILIGGEPSVRAQRLRRQRRGLGGGGDCGGARNNT